MTINSLNNQCLNDFLVTSATNGVTRTLTVSNSTNAANSAAQVIAQVAGGTAADPQLTTLISGGQTWALGLDNSDADAWVLSGNAALGTTNVMRVDSTGVINYPLQSAFLAYQAGVANATGDNTAYTVVFSTEKFDQNNDFDGTSTFTAPVTGRYQFSFTSRYAGILNTHTVGESVLSTSNRIYPAAFGPYQSADNNGNLSVNLSILADMDAADTAQLRVTVYNGTKVINVAAYFSGILSC